jgi:hypothetical protein
MTAEIGFFFIPFDKEFFCATKQTPVDVFGRFACVVQPVFCKLDGKTMKRTFVQACDKTFNYLPGNQLQGTDLLYFPELNDRLQKIKLKLCI